MTDTLNTCTYLIYGSGDDLQYNWKCNWCSDHYSLLLLLLLLLQSVDIPGLGFGQSEYFPYVSYKVNVDMMDTKV